MAGAEAAQNGVRETEMDSVEWRAQSVPAEEERHIVKMKLKIIQNALSVISFEWTSMPPSSLVGWLVRFGLVWFVGRF